MKEFFQKYWKHILSFITGCIIGLLLVIPSCNQEPKTIVKYVDRHDTIVVNKERIVEKTKIKYIDRVDTFYVYKGDTVYINNLPIEHKQYCDTITTDSTSSTEIKIDYSGFKSEIDNVYIKHNYFEKQETIIKEPKKVGLVWYVGIGAGAGAHINISTHTFGYGPQFGIYGGIGLGGQIKH